MTLALIILFSVLGGVGSALIASLLFVGRDNRTAPAKNPVLSYATGTMLGAALLGMIPHALARLPAQPVLLTVLIGILAFFVMEKLLVWRHCHEPMCLVHARPGPLLLAGDAVHNAVDGVAIALAFLVSPELGVITSIAVIAHEIPQEVGDIMILIDDGYGRNRAILLNSLASLTTLPAALIAFWLGSRIESWVPFALAVSAASFLYIALADLTPDHRTRTSLRETSVQVAGIVLGVATIMAVQQLA